MPPDLQGSGVSPSLKGAKVAKVCRRRSQCCSTASDWVSSHKKLHISQGPTKETYVCAGCLLKAIVRGLSCAAPLIMYVDFKTQNFG